MNQDPPRSSDPKTSFELNPPPHNSPDRPKIPLILLRNYREPHLLSDENHQKLHLKTFQTMKFEANQQINPSIQSITQVEDSTSKFTYSSSYEFFFFEDIYLFSKLKYFHSLSSLELNLQTTKQNSQLFEDVFFKNLPDLKNLTHFKMSFIFDFSTSPKFIQELFRCLQRLKKLTNLSLNFQAKYHLGPGKLKHLPRYLKRLKQIHSLELILDRLCSTDEDIPNITSVLPFLRQVSLNFGTGKTFKGSTLVTIFHSLQNLQAITINLKDCSIRQEKNSSPLAQGLELLNPYSIEKLDIHLPHNLDSERFLKISEALKKFTVLHFLRLNFIGCSPLSNESMESICSALKSLSSLRSLSLSIPFSATNRSIVSSIASVLESLQNLTKLKLDFPNDLKTSQDQLFDLFTNIGILTSLQSLEISLMNPQELSEYCLQALAQSLQNLPLLYNLALHFKSASFISSSALIAIADSLKKLQNLTFLGLMTWRYQRIDEKVIEKIAEVLYCLPSLYSVAFAFRGYSALGEKGENLASLWTALREMKNIHKVSLDAFTIEVNENEVDELKKIKIVKRTELW